MTIIHIIDTETTGLQVHQNAHVIEIGIATIQVGAGIIETWSSLVNPPTLDAESIKVAEKVHGISKKQILAAPSWKDVWREAQAYTGRWAEAMWTAWNIGFDRCMVRRTFLGLDDFNQIQERLGAPVELLTHSKHGWPERFDLDEDPIPWTECARSAYSRTVPTKGHTRSWYSREFEPNPWGLKAAAEREDVPFDGDAHRAITDAKVAAQLYERVLLGTVKPVEEQG